MKKYNIVSNGYSNYSDISMTEEDYTKALEMATIGLEMAKLHVPFTPILELRVKLNIAKSLIGLKDFEASKSLINEIINDPILELFIREKAHCYDLRGIGIANNSYIDKHSNHFLMQRQWLKNTMIFI